MSRIKKMERANQPRVSIILDDVVEKAIQEYVGAQLDRVPMEFRDQIKITKSEAARDLLLMGATSREVPTPEVPTHVDEVNE